MTKSNGKSNDATKHDERRHHLGKQMPFDIYEYAISDRGRGARWIIRHLDRETRERRYWRIIAWHKEALKEWQKELVDLAFDGYDYRRIAKITGKGLFTVYDNIETISKIFRKNAQKVEHTPPFRH